MIRALLVASAAALVAGVAAILATTAALDIHWDPQMAVVQAVAAVWIVQAPMLAYLLSRRREGRHAVLRDRLDGPGA